MEGERVCGLKPSALSLVGTMDLTALLARAAGIFLEFCRKTALSDAALP